MKLVKILPKIKLPVSIAGACITGICEDSRQIRKGEIFFCLRNKNFDVYRTLGQTAKKAAAIVVCREDENKARDYAGNAIIIAVEDVNASFRQAVDIFYGFDTNDFVFIGITGTKGKTTTAFLLYEGLIKLGLRAGLLSTLNYYTAKKVYPALNTTPGYLTSRKLFAQMKAEKITHVVMEVSSHAIEQDRIAGIKFSRLIFTNLGRDHLDYHKTIDNYFAAKKKLFMDNPQALAIVNADDSYGRIIARIAKKSLQFGFNKKYFCSGLNPRISRQGSRFILACGSEKKIIITPLIGRHNISNILAAAGTLKSLGFKLKDIAAAIESFEGVDGRLQEVTPDVFVDYAHTPDSLEKAILALKEIGYKKIICVFGCGGNRDKGKRSLMGKAACAAADMTIITSDNPRDEVPLEICRQIETGFYEKKYEIIVDRRQAINHGIDLQAQYGLCGLLIAGKGHENYQIIGKKKKYFKDSEVAREYVKKRNRKNALITDFKILERLLDPVKISNLFFFRPIEGFSIDSRTIKPGQAYIALKGTLVDGHDFIRQAYENGAAAIISQKNISNKPPIPFYVVKDTFKVTAKLARYLRELKKLFVIAVTGSVGKTTTKEMLAFLLSCRQPVLKNLSTENNIFGAAKTIFSLAQQKIAVIEIGTNAPGEIKTLAEMIRPDIGIVMFVKPVHLQGLKSLQGVFKEKISLFEISSKTKAVLNCEDDYLKKYAGREKIYWFGNGYKNSLSARLLKQDNKKALFLIAGKYKLNMPVPFDIFIFNALAAIAAGRLLGFSLTELVKRMNKFMNFPSGRMQTQRIGNFDVINDAYNSNPFALRQALKVVARFKQPKIAVLADMRELGKESEKYHRELADDVLSAGFDAVLTIGNWMRCLQDELIRKKYKFSRHCAGYIQAANIIKTKQIENNQRYLIFLKGSRTMALEKIIALLK